MIESKLCCFSVNISSRLSEDEGQIKKIIVIFFTWDGFFIIFIDKIRKKNVCHFFRVNGINISINLSNTEAKMLLTHSCMEIIFYSFSIRVFLLYIFLFSGWILNIYQQIPWRCAPIIWNHTCKNNVKTSANSRPP